METTFGPVQARTGDYVIIPRSVTHRWVPGAGGLRACRSGTRPIGCERLAARLTAVTCIRCAAKGSR